MSHHVVDIDGDSDVEVREMTASQIKSFRKQKKTPQKEKKRSKSVKKSRQKSKKIEKITILSSSSSSSNKEKRPKPKSKSKKKKEPVEKERGETLESLWGRQVKEQELLKFGNAKLVRAQCKNPSLKYSAKARQTLRAGVTWWISQGDYLQNNWKQIFHSMYEMNARDLRIIQNQYPNILKEIHHVRMDSLEILYLFENKIVSIQYLARIRLPVLKDLSLRNNLITVVDPLAKMGLEHLEVLDLHGNFIIDMSRLYFINFLSLKILYLDWKPSNVMIEDLSFLAKFKVHSGQMGVMESIIVQSKDRLSQKRVDEMLGGKFKVPPHFLLKRKMS